MAHLNERFSLIPFSDMADCPNLEHFAIGSPYFDPLGRPLYAEPVIVAVNTDIFDQEMPRCSALVVSCSTKPYHSYGPVMRKFFEQSQVHRYPDVRRGLEGVMDLAEVREISPGALEEQTDKIFLACVSPLTRGTNQQILENTLQHLSQTFSTLPIGSTLRMPIIGTGKAAQGKATEEMFRKVVEATLSSFYPALIPGNHLYGTRRMFLIHPLEYEFYLLLHILSEKAVFLSILDKLGLNITDKRLVYGMAYKKAEDVSNFQPAIEQFNKALDTLIQGERKVALKEAARAAEIEPDLRGMYVYISELAQKNGMLEAIAREALSLAQDGKLREALSVAQTLHHFGISEKEKNLIISIRDSYLDSCIAAMEGRLLYENYMLSEETLQNILSGGDIDFPQSPSRPKSPLSESDLKSLEYLKNKISKRIVENTLHIAIRKLMADYVELSATRRAIDNLLELDRHKKVVLTEREHTICQEIYKLCDMAQEKLGNISHFEFQKLILEKLLVLLPEHGTLRLEAARHYLKCGGEKNKSNSLNRMDIQNAWNHLEIGYEKNPHDYGILSYLGFLILAQGQKHLLMAEEFFLLMARLIERELSHGKFGIRSLKSLHGEMVSVSIKDTYILKSQKYYQAYQESAQIFAKLAKAIYNSEGTAALNLYQQAMDSLLKVGRSDLVSLYESLLGETWVTLLCRNQQHLGSIPLPIGEISLDFLFHCYRKVRYWIKYKNLQSEKVQKSISHLIQKVGKQLAKN